MRRKPGMLTTLEQQLVDYASEHPDGFYGYEFRSTRPEIPNPTIYRALRRLEKHGRLASELRDASESYRPKQRVYRLSNKPVKPGAAPLPEPRVVWQPQPSSPDVRGSRPHG